MSLVPISHHVVQSLEHAEYAAETVRQHLLAVLRFGTWLQRQRITLGDISEATVTRYVQHAQQQAPSVTGPRPYKAIGLRHLLSVLRQQGVIAVRSAPHPVSSVESWLLHFAHHLEHVTGCAPTTRHNYVRNAGRLFHEVFADGEVVWAELTASVLTQFVRREAAKFQPSACGQPVTATRALIRYLTFQGVVSESLLGAIPAVLTRRHATIPRAIPAADVERVLSACREDASYGLREKAILLLLARLGLRAGEVIRLQLDDIDWGRGCLLVQAGKTHRARSLPLSQEVGEALAAYLQHARPASVHREVFLRWRPPFTPLQSSTSISTLTRKVLRRADIQVYRSGAHTLRHSLATGLVCNGVSFKLVADVLGHQALASTEIYAKLDLGSLSQVALPWPGGAQ
ncbi:MAG: tyrosine-type recombinase/integrase [Deltaproteobacteria bacterium]|nr:tyrosine-type recombinase/integrase [Deltaproteobacteria bacterium]